MIMPPIRHGGGPRTPTQPSRETRCSATTGRDCTPPSTTCRRPCCSVAALFELLALATRKESFRQVAFWTLIVGAIGGAAAVLSGLQAEENIAHGDAVHRVMETHELLGFITLAIFGVLAVWRIWRERRMGATERALALGAGARRSRRADRDGRLRRAAGVRPRGRHSDRSAHLRGAEPVRGPRARRGRGAGRGWSRTRAGGSRGRGSSADSSGVTRGRGPRRPARHASARTLARDASRLDRRRRGARGLPPQHHATGDHAISRGRRRRDPAPTPEATRRLAEALQADSITPSRVRLRDGYLETAWLDSATGRPTARRPLGTGVVRVRAWADPGRPGNTVLTVETLYRPLADPSLPERELERQVPRTHPTAVKVETVLAALLKRHGGPPPPAAAQPSPSSTEESSENGEE